jgi:hypothetical protein
MCFRWVPPMQAACAPKRRVCEQMYRRRCGAVWGLVWDFGGLDEAS